MASGFKVTVDLRGFKEFADKLEFAPTELAQVKKKMLHKGTDIVQKKAKEEAPVDDGPLRASITKKVSVDAGRVGTNSSYAPYMEYGTGIYSEYPGAPRKPIRPKRGNYLIFKPKSSKGKYVTSKNGKRYYKRGSGEFVKVKEVKGSKPHFFMKKAFEEVEGRMHEVLEVGYDFVSKLKF